MKFHMQAVLFDFDYTLADSSQGAVECINFALNALDLPSVSFETACQTIGLSLDATFRMLTTSQHWTQSREFARLFQQRADQVMADLTLLYPAVPRSMRLLKQKGMVLGIVSTKFRYRIEMILRREHLEEIFDVIIGAEDIFRTKPDPEGLTLAQQRVGVASRSSLYVGDSVIDAETAHKGGTPFAAVLSGVTPRDALEAYAPLKIADTLDQLVHWLLD